MEQRLWRDASGRLTCDWLGVESTDYPAACRAIADTFSLVSASELVVGPDQMFRDFRRGDQTVGLEWDIWMGFSAVAKSAASEPVILDIAAWMSSHPDLELRRSAL